MVGIEKKDIHMEREQKKERELIKALELGEQSGFVDDFDPEQNRAQLHRKHS